MQKRRKYIPAVGPKLKKLLIVLFAAFALLMINSMYLASVTFLEWYKQTSFQDYFYQYMFLGHLTLGVLIVVPVIVYGVIHILNARNRPNRRAVKVGYVLFAVSLLLLFSGLLLTRGLPLLEVRHPDARTALYWMHVITPLLLVWLFILHRLAGKRINWRAGGGVLATAVALSAVVVYFQAQDPRQWNQVGPASGEQYFFPSLARTTTGNFIPADKLMMDQYCAQCHQDAHESWSHSVHRFASFNNPAYLFSVRNTREAMLQRDGDLQGSRFCAGCHDLVPFFSGAFDDPNFDDVNHPTSQAGITCSGCHAITHVNSPRGNADYTIEEPLHYPFTFSESSFLQWVNQTLIKAKPAFHKNTFLKPLHRTTEFCGTCHKVHLPEELNAFRWLRGQNHYDPYQLSGVSGHGVSSFYYPPKAKHNCNGCHMPLQASDDFAARQNDDSGELTVHDHQFPSANTAIPHLLGMPESVNEAHRAFLEDSLRVDLVAVRSDGQLNGEVQWLDEENTPELHAGQSYLLEAVVRTLTLGHLFTQGTVDSNEIWMDVVVRAGGRVIGHSGQLDDGDRSVDPYAHFINVFVLDKNGNRINRRNAEDIFVPLYNHQIPPGAADSLHYLLNVPDWVDGPIEVELALKYRKFDTEYFQLFMNTDGPNDLPITTIATQRVQLNVAGASERAAPFSSEVPQWMRLNDYGIGLLRKPGLGELRQAEAVFAQVESLGRADGPMNLARVYLREGRLEDAAAALQRAEPLGPYPWVLNYLSAQVNRQLGQYDASLELYKTLLETRFNEARKREFDFGENHLLQSEYAQAEYEQGLLSAADPVVAKAHFDRAEAAYQKALSLDPESASAHFGLAQLYRRSGDQVAHEKHRALHDKYKVDDNLRDRAIRLAREKYPAAAQAANDSVIYALHGSEESAQTADSGAQTNNTGQPHGE